MMKHIPAILLLCCLALGCHHETGPVVSEQDALNTRALAAALHFAYQTVKPEVPPSPGLPAGVSKMPPSQVSPKPRFEARMPPQGTGRKIVLFSAQWCGPCVPQKQIFHQFVKSRGLDTYEWGEVDVDAQPVKYKIPDSIPTIILIDSQGNELNRIQGLASFEQIEDLWLSGKRPHNLNGLPMSRAAFTENPDIASILLQIPKLIKSVATRFEFFHEIRIPLPVGGEIVVPVNVSIKGGPIEGGFRVAVETGTTAPWVRSKWLGSLYPVPITAVSVVGTKATVELRGWQDLVISLEGP